MKKQEWLEYINVPKIHIEYIESVTSGYENDTINNFLELKVNELNENLGLDLEVETITYDISTTHSKNSCFPIITFKSGYKNVDDCLNESIYDYLDSMLDTLEDD